MADLTAPRRSPASAIVADHRREQRQLTVLMVGKVRDAHGEYACVVNDISRGGLRARFPRAPRVGERLTFDLRDVPTLSATVRWVEGCQAGVAFDHPLDLDAVALRQQTSLTPRAPRFRCDRPAKLIVAGRELPTDVVDLSLGGAKLGVPGGRMDATGQAATLVLPVLNEPRAGTVRWDDGDRLGFQFAAPLTINDLSRVTSSYSR